MRIGIDARFYGPAGKGLGRYTQEIVDNVIKIANADKFSPAEKNTGVSFSGGEIEFVVFLSSDNFNEFICSSDKVRKVLLPIRWYSWREQLIMPFLIAKENLDLIHYPHFNVPILTPVKFVVTIHDLILTHFPTLRATTLSAVMYRFKNLAYRLVISTAVRRARRIITVSEFTKKDLIQKFSVNPEKIRITYEGVANLATGKDHLFVAKLGKSEILEKYNIYGSDFILYVGNAYPHKNLDFLLTVFKELLQTKPKLRLVLVGKEDYFYKRLHKLAEDLGLWTDGDYSSSVVFTGYVSDQDLEDLYQKSLAYVFPSKYEGFGLPPLEAMAKGCPVVSSNQGSLPEILGEAALYFNPDDYQDALFKIRDILDNEETRNDFRQRGLSRVKKYNWDTCAQDTFNIYKEVLNEKS